MQTNNKSDISKPFTTFIEGINKVYYFLVLLFFLSKLRHRTAAYEIGDPLRRVNHTLLHQLTPAVLTIFNRTFSHK